MTSFLLLQINAIAFPGQTHGLAELDPSVDDSVVPTIHHELSATVEAKEEATVEAQLNSVEQSAHESSVTLDNDLTDPGVATTERTEKPAKHGSDQHDTTPGLDPAFQNQVPITGAYNIILP